MFKTKYIEDNNVYTFMVYFFSRYDSVLGLKMESIKSDTNNDLNDIGDKIFAAFVNVSVCVYICLFYLRF